MNPLENYKQAVFALALEFEKHKDPDIEYEWINWLVFPWHFPWDDYGIYCDSSEFYSWTPNEMYLILKDNIPYDIATEHQSISIYEMWAELPHYNLKTYWQYRKVNIDMSLEDFLRFLKREYHLKQADIHTKEFQEENDKLLKKLTNDFLQNVKSL